MKKLLSIALAIALFAMLACAAETLRYGKGDEALAGGFEGALEAEDRISAYNAMLDEGGACLITQQELIENLQGYSLGDVRTDIQPVAFLAQGDLYIVCGAETAAEANLTDLTSLKQYLEENEYGLQLMRSFKATNADYASMILMEELYFDSDIFVDEEDQYASINDGLYVLVVDTSKAMELEGEGCVVLGALTEERTKEYPDLPCAAECGIPVVRGTYYAIVVPTGADASAFEGASLAEEALSAANLRAPDEGISIADDIEAMVYYMTAEGLFFY